MLYLDFEDDDDDLDLTEDENAISFVPATDVDPDLFLLDDEDNPDQIQGAPNGESTSAPPNSNNAPDQQPNNNDLDDEDDEKEADEYFSDKVTTRSREDLENCYR